MEQYTVSDGTVVMFHPPHTIDNERTIIGVKWFEGRQKYGRYIEIGERVNKRNEQALPPAAS